MRSFFWLVVALGLVSRAAWAEDSFSWPGWEIPGTKIVERGALAIIEDADAESVQEIEKDGKKTEQHVTLEQRVSRQGIAKAGLKVLRTPNIPYSKLEPGVYELKVRLKIKGELGLIGTPIHLAVVGAGDAQDKTWNTCDFTEEDTYRELTMLYEVDPTGKLRLPARQARHTWHTRSYYNEVYPDAPPMVTERDPSKFLYIVLDLPQTKYSSQSGMPPNTLRSISVDWVKFEKIQPAPAITVRYAKAQLLWMRPGMTNKFLVSLENFTAEPQQRTLVVTLHNHFDTVQEVRREEVKLDAGATKVVEVDWPTNDQTPWWGYGLLAEIRQGDTVESSARDYFQLHPRVYEVHVMGCNSRRNNPFRENETFQNMVEVFGATEGDCAGTMPQHENWISGMSSGGRPETMPLARGMVEGNKRNGIASHMYLFAGGTGTALMDLMVEHPEWVSSRAIATDTIYTKIRARQKAVADHDFSKGYIDPPLEDVPHIEQHLTHWFPELQKRIEDQVTAFVKATGYMGIRWDVGMLGPRTNKTVLGTTLPYNMDEAMQHAADNFNSLRDKLLKIDPNFEFGANMDTWAYLEQVGNRNITPKPPEEYPEFVALAKTGGMFMDEGTMSAPFYDHYMNRWEDALWGMAQKRDMAGRFGGVYQLFSPHRDSAGHFAHDDIYWAVCIIASGSHYVGRFSAPPYTRASVGEFITRFSEYFWNPKRRLLEDARDAIFVDAPADVWYADVTAWEDVGAKRRYIIPLINPPVVERLRRNKSNELPPPIDEAFNIEIQVPDGYSKAEAWMLTWEPEVGAHKLDVNVADGTATVKFPGLQLFRTLVVEFAK